MQLINTEDFEFEVKPALWNLSVEQNSGSIYKWNAWQEVTVQFHSLSSKKVTEKEEQYWYVKFVPICFCTFF